jgi:hypothetical protein
VALHAADEMEPDFRREDVVLFVDSHLISRP